MGAIETHNMNGDGVDDDLFSTLFLDLLLAVDSGFVFLKSVNLFHLIRAEKKKVN
jgi:hypothetical protein